MSIFLLSPQGMPPHNLNLSDCAEHHHRSDPSSGRNGANGNSSLEGQPQEGEQPVRHQGLHGRGVGHQHPDLRTENQEIHSQVGGEWGAFANEG